MHHHRELVSIVFCSIILSLKLLLRAPKSLLIQQRPMYGEPINALNTGLAAFQKDVYKDEIASLRLLAFCGLSITQD